MPRPYCVRCQCEMHPDKNGVVLEIYGALWHADLWKCPVCGTEIIAGYGFEPMAFDCSEDYLRVREQAKADRLYTVAVESVGATA